MSETVILYQTGGIKSADRLERLAVGVLQENAAMAASNALISFASIRRLRPVASIPPSPSPPSPSFGSSRIFDREPKFASVRVGRSRRWHVSPASSGSTSSPSMRIEQDTDSLPTPVVLIDQDSDPNATIVEVSFGDRLGNLLDTTKALKDLGLDVVKGTVSTGPSVTQIKLFITRLHTGRKVEDPDMLERIRLTILNNLLKYHPESSERLALGEAFGIKAPQKKVDIDVATHINIKDDGPKRSMLYIETADRPGLLMEIIKILSDINVSVESAEIDTEGLVANDKFHVSYRGAALNSSLSQVLINCLRYYLRRPETDEDSY